MCETPRSYSSSALRALQSVVAHDRLDTEFESEQDQVAAVDEFFEIGALHHQEVFVGFVHLENVQPFDGLHQ